MGSSKDTPSIMVPPKIYHGQGVSTTHRWPGVHVWGDVPAMSQATVDPIAPTNNLGESMESDIVTWWFLMDFWCILLYKEITDVLYSATGDKLVARNIDIGESSGASPSDRSGVSKRWDLGVFPRYASWQPGLYDVCIFFDFSLANVNIQYVVQGSTMLWVYTKWNGISPTNRKRLQVSGNSLIVTTENGLTSPAGVCVGAALGRFWDMPSTGMQQAFRVLYQFDPIVSCEVQNLYLAVQFVQNSKTLLWTCCLIFVMIAFKLLFLLITRGKPEISKTYL